MKEYHDLEQNHFSRTATLTYKIVHDFTKIMNWLAYYDRYYENKN